ncbi:MAG: SDR family NAD(P)-dependent oxidoreductase [Kiritimatiellae bacterium]|nr:SDR family NAD(P)-dependent oxidoreductase [Kiritimatiellia bacterium]
MNVLITGASSGIGRALALECAKRGDRLFVCARNIAGLAQVAAECDAVSRGCCTCTQIDVRDRGALEKWMVSSDELAPLDMVVANAGVSTGEETEENVRRTFDVNISGCIDTVLCAIRLMRPRRRGKIVVLSSLAGYGPLAKCPSYSASKSFVKTWALALRGMLRADGISVVAVCPGFVRSRITDANTCPMPFFMEAEEAARRILRGVDRDRGVVSFPWPMRFAAWLYGALPWRLSSFIGGWLPGKAVRR